MKRIYTYKVILCFIITLFTITGIQAKVKLPHLISNGMILQRNVPLKIWGWASSGEKVSVTFFDKTYTTKADKKGNWNIELPSYNAGGPYSMQINDIKIKDILIGDVWLCSGQSNMELPIRRVLDLYADEVKQINNPEIRLFRAPMHYNFREKESDLQGGNWKTATQENVLDFSAAAYFFAKELYDTYKIPVGLINTAIGGSPAEAWISAEAIKKYPTLETEVQKCAAPGFVEETKKQEQQAGNEWYSTMIKTDKGISLWHKENIDISDWQDYYLPGLWKDKGIDVKNAVIWLRKEFEVAKEDVGKPAILRLGYIIDSDSAFVNGRFVGTTGYQYPPRIYQVPEGILKAGKNSIAVRIVTNEWGGMKEDKPYKIIIGNKETDLTGEWKYRVGTELPPSPPNTFFQYKPMGLYNGMIAPVTNYKVKGILWYQGESNISRAKEYMTLFPDLIKDWRMQRGDPQLPFIYAQLPELNKPCKQPTENGMAELREAQRQALSLPYTGMAVTLGLGEWNDIHPLNKKDVANRLALEAKRVVYGDTSVVSTGPQLKDMRIEGNAVILTFGSVGEGLYSNSIINGFAIAGANKEYVWAEAAILSKDQVKVWSSQVQNPVSVRYAWADNPAGANLKNREGLLASPFTTE